MTTPQWVDATLRLIGYLISWPMVTLVVVVTLRRRIISTLAALSERARRASLGPVTVEFDQNCSRSFAGYGSASGAGLW